MSKKVIFASCSALVLGLCLTPVAFASQPTSKHHKKHNNEMNSHVKSVPTVAGPDITAKPRAAHPFRLAHHLGLSPQSRIRINGFASAGVAYINSKKDYAIPDHGAIDNEANFSALSSVGLQISAKIYHNISVVAQMVADGDDTNGNKAYQMKLDYGYARYAVNPDNAFRIGRLRLPVFMYSATQRIGNTYPWVTLPNEVYRIVPFDNFNGVDYVFQHALGRSSWNFRFEPYVGSGSSEFDLYTANSTSDSTAVPTAQFKENSLMGAVATISNKNISLRATYAHLKLSGTYLNLIPTPPVNTVIVNNQSDDFYSVGAKAHYKGFMLSGEFANRDTPAPLADLRGYYAMLGYKLRKWLPNFTYAHLKTTNASSLTTGGVERAQAQESYTLGLVYYANSNIDLKVSAADIKPLDGTRGLFDTVQPGQLKKNNYMYMGVIDAIF